MAQPNQCLLSGRREAVTYTSLSNFVQGMGRYQSHYLWHNQLARRYTSLIIFDKMYISLIIFAASLINFVHKGLFWPSQSHYLCHPTLLVDGWLAADRGLRICRRRWPARGERFAAG